MAFNVARRPAQLGASQPVRAGASWCARARLAAPRARLPGGHAAARALVRGAGAPERAGASACSPGAPARAHARASSVRLGCSAGAGARSGGAAALHGAPTSRVLGWRRSTSTMTVASSATVLAWASVTTCVRRSTSGTVMFQLWGAGLPLRFSVLFFLHGYVYRILTLNRVYLVVSLAFLALSSSLP